MFLIYDTETTGLPKNFKAPITDSGNWPRMVQIAWQLHNKKGELVENKNFIVYPEDFDIPFASTKIHGITNEKAKEEGLPLNEVLDKFQDALSRTQRIIGHNVTFDQNIVGAEFHRLQLKPVNMDISVADTMVGSTNYLKLPGGRGGRFKSPKLQELYEHLFQEKFDEAHNAAADVNATARAFFELVRLGIYEASELGLSAEELQSFRQAHREPIQSFDIQINEQIKDFKNQQNTNLTYSIDTETTTESPYFHFHNHSSFSILTATSKVDELIDKALQENMPAVGLTDQGNLMGAFQFLSKAANVNKDEQKIVPIVGCEFYVSENHKKRKFTKDSPDRRFTQLLLAKNLDGFRNLSKLSSFGFIEGFYAGIPRISRELIVEHKENLIATTGSLMGEIPSLILNQGETKGEEAFLWWKDLFGDDFYVELIRHGLEEEDYVNQVLIQLAQKHGVKILAQNNTFYIDKNDAEAQDILLCVRDGTKVEMPIGKGRDKRFGFPNQEFYFKSQEQMRSLFADVPEAIENLSDFLKKFETYELQRKVLLPKFEIPEEFIDPEDEKDNGIRGENNYLKHLTFEGAKKRYGDLTPEIEERLNFELETIANTGYPGYFLIVQDFTKQARKMGVSVGPGRGSAAGSAVAYCTGITNVDPIKYDLLFERFLNPDRVSLPDIDIDFDDRGRDQIIQWVVDKYGKEQVAQIITYGTMAGKSAIRDAGRVLSLPLNITDGIAKKTHASLNKFIDLSEKEIREKFNSDEAVELLEIKKISEGNNLEANTLKQAKVIEGSIRNTGVHPCGVIITPSDLQDLVPLAVAKDSDFLITQFDNNVVEDAGLLKMDFLGLRTLTILKDAVRMVEENHDVKIDLDELPLDDEKTYQIFQKGQTVGIFQYESAGMQKHLKSLKPDKFDDLIAMNALYRPGPLQYIPNFINRKFGREEIQYDLPEMEEYLSDTYGITVYQEQVMLLSQKLAGFTKGQADSLRKGMGKKKKSVIDELYPKFIEGGINNNHPKDKLDKIWKDWEAFASYAFNKSHSTCYALLAYQTAYLKAHYPSEFLASVLTNNMSNIKTVSFFMEESKRMGIEVFGPSVNESKSEFSVNPAGAIRFGLEAIKGVGGSAVESIVEERNKNGFFVDIFDFAKRVDLRSVNKKSFESLALAGAFDEFEGMHRGRFFHDDGSGTNIEKILRFASALQKEKDNAQMSLFSDEDLGGLKNPDLTDCEPWSRLKALNHEKELIGIYISDHPLNKYKYEMKYYGKIQISDLKDNEERFVNREIVVCGMISTCMERVSSRDQRPFGLFTLEDYNDQMEFRIFGENYLKWKHLLHVNSMVALTLKINKNTYNNRIYKDIQRVRMLEDMLKEQSSSLTIKLDIKETKKEDIENLHALLNEFQGQKELNFELLTSGKKIKDEFKSPKVKVDINSRLLERIEDKLQLDFYLN